MVSPLMIAGASGLTELGEVSIPVLLSGDMTVDEINQSLGAGASSLHQLLPKSGRPPSYYGSSWMSSGPGSSKDFFQSDPAFVKKDSELATLPQRIVKETRASSIAPEYHGSLEHDDILIFVQVSVWGNLTVSAERLFVCLRLLVQALPDYLCLSVCVSLCACANS